MSRLGRDRYIDRLNQLRSHPLMRDYEVLAQKLDLTSDGKLPDVYFDATFVDFFKDNYSRLLRCIDRDPGMEIPVVTNGIQKGISREMVDGLRAQNEEKERILQEAQLKLESLNQKLGQEQADHRRTKEASALELNRIKQVNEGLQRHQEEELNKLQTEMRAREDDFRRQMEGARRAAEAEADRLARRNEADTADLRATISRLEVDLMKANKSKVQELAAQQNQAEARFKDQVTATKLEQHKVAQLDERNRSLEQRVKAAEGKVGALEAEVQSKEKKIGILEREAEENEAAEEKMEEEIQGLKKQLLKREAGAKEMESRIAELEKEVTAAKEAAQDKEKEGEGARDMVTKAETKAKEAQEAQKATQSELDDLLMVFGDMEEKVEKYKAKLKKLGQEISDDEEDGDEDEDGEDDDENESGDEDVE